MPDWLTHMDDYWLWLSLGVLLCAAEIVAPGFFLVWLGVAAIVTGVLAFLLPIGAAVELGIFAVLAFIALYSARRWLQNNPIVSSDPLLNQRGGRLVGKTFFLVTAIENGRGRAQIGDGQWPVHGPDAPLGAKVRVVSADGGTLVVELA